MINAQRSALARLASTAVLAGAVLAGSAPALAQEAQNVAATEALFKRSVELMKQGNFTEACPGIEEVVRRAPDGIGAKLTLAECYEGAGKLASAWGTWHKAGGQARASNQGERATTAKERAAQLEPRLSHLVITVPPEVAALPGLVIKYDEVTSARTEWSLPLPIDGSTHTVSATAAGKLAWSLKVEVAVERAQVEVKVPMLDDAPAPPPPAALPPPPPPVLHAPPPPPPPSSAGVPTWAWVVGGAGLGLLGAAAAFRADQSAAGSTLDTTCGASRVCPPGYDWAPVYDRETRSFGLFVGLGAAGIGAVGASIVGIVMGAKARPAERPAAWTLAPATLPGHATGALYTQAW
jgi:hypothetical protein